LFQSEERAGLRSNPFHSREKEKPANGTGFLDEKTEKTVAWVAFFIALNEPERGTVR
jgi:hypothetical protein